MKTKSYKREVATGLILYVLGMTSGLYGDIEMLKIIIWPIITFASGAFGLEGMRQIYADKVINQ